MTTMTLPVTAERVRSRAKQSVSQLMPLLVALAMLAATGVVSVLISGPMH